MIFITPVLGIIGIIGGLLCATADLLLDLKGTKNKKRFLLGAIFIIRKLEVVIDDRRGLGNEGKESDIWKWEIL